MDSRQRPSFLGLYLYEGIDMCVLCLSPLWLVTTPGLSISGYTDGVIFTGRKGEKTSSDPKIDQDPDVPNLASNLKNGSHTRHMYFEI